jgi:hypothetical protein
MYTAKLHPDLDTFLQRPSKNYIGRNTWYDRAPLGQHTIANMMRNISESAGSSQIYTNHSIKASTATVLKKAGVPSQDIMTVTGHKNIASLSSYAKGPNSDDRANMCKILSSYGKNTETTLDIHKISCKTSTSTIETAEIENTTQSIFAGAHFAGPVTINVQVNK